MKNIAVCINDFGLGHYNEFLCLYEKIKDDKELNLKYCLVSHLLPEDCLKKLKEIFGDGLLVYTGYKTNLDNYISDMFGGIIHAIRYWRDIQRIYRTFKADEEDIYCINFCCPLYRCFAPTFKHTIQVWGGLGRYLEPAELAKEGLMDKLGVLGLFWWSGKDKSALSFNLANAENNFHPAKIKNLPGNIYNLSPLMVDKAEKWELPFKKYNLIYLTTYAAVHNRTALIELIDKTKDENFIAFGKIENLPEKENLSYQGLVPAEKFLYALRNADSYIGTMGLGPIHTCNRDKIPLFGIAASPEQLGNVRFCPNAVVMDSIANYSDNKHLKEELRKSDSVAAKDPAKFIAEKIKEFIYLNQK